MKRIPELDALRGLAALVIVAYHLWLIKYPIAGTAVDLFFVMSGYLITSIILDQHADPGFLRTFYIRRSLRIWPIYYLALVATLVLCAGFASPISWDGVIYAITYTQHIQDYTFTPVVQFSEAFRHTWTLAIEEQFYLIWPLVVVLGGRKAVTPTALAFIGAAVFSRGIGFAPWILLTRGDGLALGGLLSVILRPEAGQLRPRIAPRSALVAAAILALVLRAVGTLRPGGMTVEWGFSLKMVSINLAYFSIIGGVVLYAGSKALIPLRNPALVYLGSLSYGIYLYHHIVFYFIDLAGPSHRWLADSLKIVLSFGLAALSWRYVEKPILSLKSRFDYGASSTRLRATRTASNIPLSAEV